MLYGADPMLVTRAAGYFASMTGRIFVVMLAGFLVAGTAALMFANASRKQSLEMLHLQRAAARVQEYLRITGSRAPPERIRAELATLPGIHPANAGPVRGKVMPALVSILHDRLGEDLPIEAADVPLALCYPLYRVGGTSGGPRPEWRMRSPSCWHIRVNGAAMLVETPMTIVNEQPLIDPRFLAVLAFGALAVSVVVARVATAPLTRLRQAAIGFGNDVEQPPIDEHGPSDVREAARAFNRMQARLREHIEERATMLAAISHDLQTPMTRMRLRLEKIGDESVRAPILRDWHAMRHLVDEGLSLARAAHDRETPVLVDLNSLIDTVVADATDAGLAAHYSGRSDIEIWLAPTSIGRCLSNLVANAAIHGGGAEILVDDVGADVVVAVLDRGPGIAADRIAAMMRPFVQAGQPGRGSGLGLPIAKLLAERNGARLDIDNREGGGLVARLTLFRYRPVSGSPG